MSRRFRYKGRGVTYGFLLFGLLVVILVGCFSAVYISGHFFSEHFGSESPRTRSNLNLITNQHWQMAGVTQTGRSLQVRYNGLMLVKQDGSAGRPNPPVNLYGVRLQVKGDFSITATLTNIHGEADLSLYGVPPLIEDELRAEQGTLRMAVNGSSFGVDISDQVASARDKQANFIIHPASQHTLVVRDIGGRLSFVIDGSVTQTLLPDQSIFKNGQVWLGMSAPSVRDSFTVEQLTARKENGGQVLAVDTRQQQIMQSSNGFAAFAHRTRPSFLMGAAVALGPMVSDRTYLQLLSNFNSVTTENVGKFQFIHPLPGNNTADYNFSDMDGVVDMAREMGIKVHGHALVFGEANPAWVQDIAKNHPEQLRQVMTAHVKKVVSHYRGKVEGWDVINEPLADYDTVPGEYGLRRDIWYNAVGPDYIALALRAAHEADPQTGLWINDFGMESDEDRFNQMLQLARRLKAEGVPLTGIGFQAHIDDGDTIENDTHISTSMLRSRISAVAALGLKVRFSELDITNQSEYPVFADVISVCKSEPACVSVTLWGITDKYSSSGEFGATGIYEPGSGLPWDANEQALPAVSWIRQALSR